jgi:hypothetical protein
MIYILNGLNHLIVPDYGIGVQEQFLRDIAHGIRIHGIAKRGKTETGCSSEQDNFRNRIHDVSFISYLLQQHFCVSG